MRVLRGCLVGGFLLLALIAAGCGGDNNESAGTSTGETGEENAPAKGRPIATFTIQESEFRLAPAKPRVARSGVVELVAKNTGKVNHALEVEGPGGEAKTKLIQPGQSARLKVDLSKAGTYTMYCPVANHRSLGMTGAVIVARGASAGGAKKKSNGGGSGGGGGGGAGYGY